MSLTEVATIVFWAGAVAGFAGGAWLVWSYWQDCNSLALKSGHIIIKGRVFSERRPRR